MLTHQGDYKKDIPTSLFLKKYLKKKLKVKVNYFDGKITKINMMNLIKRTKIKTITIVGTQDCKKKNN